MDIKKLIKRCFPATEAMYLFKQSITFKWVETFIKFKERPDYIDCYRKLISRMHDDDIREIEIILDRMDFFYNLRYTKDSRIFEKFIQKYFNRFLYIFNPFDNDELVRLSQQNKRLKKIRQVSSNCFQMDNIKLPVHYFMRSVFFNEDWIKKIRNQNKIFKKCIIDAGAYVGDSALMLSRLTNQNVYAFEPMQHTYGLMLKTLDMNETKNIIPVRAALGNKSGKSTFSYIGIMDTGSTEFQNMNMCSVPYVNKEEIDIITVDEYVTANNIEIGLIKADVEGYEQKLILGAMNIIKEQKPVLLISIYHNPEDFYFIKPILEEWNLNYTYKIYKPLDYTPLNDIYLIAEPI